MISDKLAFAVPPHLGPKGRRTKSDLQRALTHANFEYYMPHTYAALYLFWRLRSRSVMIDVDLFPSHYG